MSFIKCNNSIIASNRIALYLSKRYSLPLIDRKENISLLNKYDTWLVINAPFSFCNFQGEYISAIKNNPAVKIIWVQNDYTIPIRVYRKYLLNENQVSVWSNMPYYVKTERDKYINWNKLTYDPISYKKPKHDGIIYYGAYRKGREEAFARFFKKALYPLHISVGTTDAARKFLFLTKKDVNFYRSFPNVIEQLQQFTATIYMEDEWSTKNYNSPANRFYEGLSAGIPMLFDHRCANTFDIAGYDISNYVVFSQKDVQDKLNQAEEIRRAQSQWRRDYRTELDKEVDKAMNER